MIVFEFDSSVKYLFEFQDLFYKMSENSVIHVREGRATLEKLESSILLALLLKILKNDFTRAEPNHVPNTNKPKKKDK